MKKLLLTFVLLIVFWMSSNAQIVVTKGTFPTICNGVTTYYNQLTDIIIAETNPADFATGFCSFEVDAVPFTQLNNGIGQVQFSLNSDFTSGSISVASNYKISINYICGGTTKLDTIRIKGLQLRTIGGAPATFDYNKQPAFCSQNGFVTGQSVMTVNTNNNFTTFTLPSTFCPDAVPYQLIGNPAGGTFSGVGVSGGYFYPSLVSANYSTVYYVANNACNSTTNSTTVINPSKPPLSANKTFLCVGDAVTFTSLAGSSQYSFYKNNILVQGPSSTDTYTTTQFATGDSIFVKILYGGCNNYSDTISIPVYPKPVVDFTISDYCAGKLPNTFTSTATIPYGTSTVSSVQWYADITNYYPSGNSINHTFAAAGTHEVKSIVTLSTGCSAFKDSTFYMGPYPTAHYSWLNTCGTNNVNFIDTSKIASGSILQWKWDFDINSTTDINSSTQSPGYSFTSAGSYYSRLIVTSDYGCKDTLTRKVITLPGVTIGVNNPYVADFNVSKSNWDFGDDSLASWDWSTFFPNTASANQIVSNQPVWHTGNTANGFYNTNERSFLNSPCFNFQSLKKPMIAIKMAMDTDNSNAGAILEASTDGGTTWKRVGKIGDGQFWYNNSGNNGRPGGYSKYSDNLVWSGHYDTDPAPNTFSGWEVAKIKLDSLAGQNSVRFRIAFGSASGAVTKYTGIALDSIWIGERNKRVVLENITNTYITNDADGGPILEAKNAIDYIRDQRPNDVSAAYYHYNIPKHPADVYNQFYSEGPNKRFGDYGSKIPQTILDGDYYIGHIYNGGTAADRIDIDDIDARILERARFRMDMSTTLVSGSITAAINIVYTDPSAIFNRNISLFTIVTEDSANGDSRFSSVVRQMLPETIGKDISRAWSYNDSINSTETWSHTLPSTSKLGVVAFIQDAATNEIYQSVYVKGQGNSGTQVLAVTSLLDAYVDNNNILVFPNPADNEINLVTLSENENMLNWILYDNLGREIKSGNPDSPIRKITINTYDLPDGIHCIKITNTKGTTYLKKILIKH